MRTPGVPRLLRAINDRAALELLLSQGPLTRPEIGRLTGLSKPTASAMLARLQQAGLVVLDGVREGATGRSAELYRINAEASYVCGLDVSPLRIAAEVADLSGRVTGSFVLETPGRSGVDAAARAVAAADGAAAAAGLSRDRLDQVVIAIQGAINPGTGRLAYAAHIPGWQGPDLVQRLQESLALPVMVENDVNLAALAEAEHGVARDVPCFVHVWVADGIGMAVVIGGALHRGATGGAGEIAYMPVATAPVMRHPRRTHTGGVQAFLGRSAQLRLLREHGARGTDPAAMITRAPGSALDALAERFAFTLAPVVGVLDPSLVVLAGDLATAGGEELRRRVEHELHCLTVPRPRVALSALEADPVLSGALLAALGRAREEIFSRSLPIPQGEQQ
ncbi:ROK family transcriptional regulator [Actinocorallia longicatena]|uniref:ROK family transcriptional regulator n=1 Tax=Actinocorallia longicatena TaxID=111803 RepID=A0ABP6Q5D6_9ACTN